MNFGGKSGAPKIQRTLIIPLNMRYLVKTLVVSYFCSLHYGGQSGNLHSPAQNCIICLVQYPVEVHEMASHSMYEFCPVLCHDMPIVNNDKIFLNTV